MKLAEEVVKVVNFETQMLILILKVFSERKPNGFSCIYNTPSR